MFLRMMKKGLLFLGMLAVMLSCSEYQDVLKNDDTAKKYAMAEELYEEGKAEESKKTLRKSMRLLEQIEPELRGKPQGQRVVYLLADTYYQLGDYILAGFKFNTFTQLYPDSEKAEEAAFKKAASYYYQSPRFNLDQTETKKGIDELQAYLDVYPDGEHSEKANEMATELRIKLEKKAYEIAKQYHTTQYYKAAIASFTNFLADYPGSPFREQAYYYRFDSAYQLAVNSYLQLMEERLNEASELSESYKRYYPEGEYLPQLEASLEDVNARLQNF